MIKQLLALILCTGLSAQLIACDACGCSINGGSIGLLDAYQNNTIGLSYNRTPFRAADRIGTGTRDVFNTAELFFSYHFSPRFQVTAILPYRYNVRKEEGQTKSQQGISDVRLLANYTLFDNVSTGIWSSLYLDLGLGIKGPTGVYDEDIYLQDLPENFNVGNGTWAALFQSRLVYRWKSFGALVNATYQRNDVSSSGYRFGDHFTGAAMVYYRTNIGPALEVTAFTGMLYEHIGRDDYPDGKAPHPTGGEGTYFTSTINFSFGDLLIGATASLPVAQSYSGDEVIGQTRFSITTAFVF